MATRARQGLPRVREQWTPALSPFPFSHTAAPFSAQWRVEAWTGLGRGGGGPGGEREVGDWSESGCPV